MRAVVDNGEACLPAGAPRGATFSSARPAVAAAFASGFKEVLAHLGAVPSLEKKLSALSVLCVDPPSPQGATNKLVIVAGTTVPLNPANRDAVAAELEARGPQPFIDAVIAALQGGAGGGRRLQAPPAWAPTASRFLDPNFWLSLTNLAGSGRWGLGAWARGPGWGVGGRARGLGLGQTEQHASSTHAPGLWPGRTLTCLLTDRAAHVPVQPCRGTHYAAA